MTLLEQIINEELEALLERKNKNTGARYKVNNRKQLIRKTTKGSKSGGNKSAVKKKKDRTGQQTKPTANRKTETPQVRNTNTQTRQTTEEPTRRVQDTQQQQQLQQQQQQRQQQQQTSQSGQQQRKPSQEGGDLCSSNDIVGKCINKIKSKISDLYNDWPQSLFSMSEDSQSREGKYDVDGNGGNKRSRAEKIVKDFNQIAKKRTTISVIRQLFTKLFELWTLLNADNASDCSAKCNAVKRNLKNYRKIYTTYRSKFSNNFKTLDINKTQLKNEYNIMEDEVGYWSERINKYSPKIREILREHIAMLDDVKSTYKSRMFWYFKAPKFMRKKTAKDQKKSSEKWKKRQASYKQWRQKRRQSWKNYVNKGPSAGGTTKTTK